jgi:hypothetical protein
LIGLPEEVGGKKGLVGLHEIYIFSALFLPEHILRMQFIKFQVFSLLFNTFLGLLVKV